MIRFYLLIIFLISGALQTTAQSCLPDGITFLNQQEIDNFKTDYPDCKIIEGPLTIHETNIAHLNGLSDIERIKGDVKITNNQMLSNMEGLNGLKEIIGSLTIENNEIQNVEGLEQLLQVKGLMYIRNNNRLKSLKGLDKLDPNSILKLFITNCDSLSYCSVKSICDYITKNIGPVTIDLNSEGCNTEAEITEICGTTSTANRKEDFVSIFPNPASDKIFIEAPNVNAIRMSIIDNSGKTIWTIDSNPNVIDISNLQNGHYILQIFSNNGPTYAPFIKM